MPLLFLVSQGWDCYNRFFILNELAVIVSDKDAETNNVGLDSHKCVVGCWHGLAGLLWLWLQKHYTVINLLTLQLNNRNSWNGRKTVNWIQWVLIFDNETWQYPRFFRREAGSLASKVFTNPNSCITLSSWRRSSWPFSKNMNSWPLLPTGNQIKYY